MKKFLFLFLAIILFNACGNGAKQSSTSNTTAPSASATTVTPATGKTPSGYPYFLHTQNKGPKPVIGDEVHYHQVLMKNDSLIRSTYLSFEPVRAVMPTADQVAAPPPPPYEALFLMSVKDSMTVFQLMDSVKNYQRPRWLKPTDTLKYQLKLLSLRDKKLVQAEIDSLKGIELITIGKTQQWIKDFQAGKLKVEKTASGLSYVIHEPGTGKIVQLKKYVNLHYIGFKLDGTVLDNTYARNQSAPYRVGNAGVKGWDEMLPKLKEGGKATVFVPAKLAYGEKGRAPKVGPNEDLVFYLEVEKVN